MAAALRIAGVHVDPGLKTTGPLAFERACELVLTLCEAACGDEAPPSEMSVTFEADDASAGRGVDYHEIILDGRACEALRTIRSQLGIHPGPGGDRPSDDREMVVEIRAIPSATLAANRRASYARRLAALERATGYAP